MGFSNRVDETGDGALMYTCRKLLGKTEQSHWTLK